MYLTKKSRLLKDPHDIRMCDNSASSSVVFVGIPWDGAVAGRPGARLGPAKIRTAFCNLPKRADVEDLGDVDVVIGDPAETWQRVEKTFRSLKDRQQILVAGGDHSVTPYVYRGLSEGRKISYVVLDAHFDLRTVSEGLTSGMATRLVKESGGDIPITVIGIREWSNPSYMFSLADKMGIEYYTIEQIHKLGIEEVADRVYQQHKNYKAYLSIDLDVVDPAFAPGVNAPSPGGLTSREVLILVSHLSKALKPIAVDTVEVSPPYDVGDITSNLAAVLLYTSIWSR
ncbi:arginase family protein [Pyrobaculum sp.]|uniref:arginase family protein n=1 Tax=Pyrobaculum sp. TaxID=2004705 RepID=UPI003179E1E9